MRLSLRSLWRFFLRQQKENMWSKGNGKHPSLLEFGYRPLRPTGVTATQPMTFYARSTSRVRIKGRILSISGATMDLVVWLIVLGIGAVVGGNIFWCPHGRCSSVKPHHLCAKRSGQQITECDAIGDLMMYCAAFRSATSGFRPGN
jgi:hypothetical protein